MLTSVKENELRARSNSTLQVQHTHHKTSRIKKMYHLYLEAPSGKFSKISRQKVFSIKIYLRIIFSRK